MCGARYILCPVDFNHAHDFVRLLRHHLPMAIATSASFPHPDAAIWLPSRATMRHTMTSSPAPVLARLEVPAKGGLWRFMQRLKGSASRRKTANHLLGLVADDASLPEVRARLRTLVDLGLWNDQPSKGFRNSEARSLGWNLFNVAKAGAVDPGVLHLAFEAGVSPHWTENNRRDDGWSTIFARTGQVDCLLTALSAGTDPHFCDTCNETALHLLVKRAVSQEIEHKRARSATLSAIAGLLEGFCDINHSGQREHHYNGGGPPLQVAVEAMDVDMVRWMLERGARVDLADGYGDFPAHWAATAQGFSVDPARCCEILDALATAGAALDTPNPRGETPLWQAFAWRTWTQAQWFIDHGSNLTTRPHTFRDPQGYEKAGIAGPTLLTLLVRQTHPSDDRAQELATRLLQADPQAWQASLPEGGTLDQWLAQQDNDWQAIRERDALEQSVAPATGVARRGPRL